MSSSRFHEIFSWISFSKPKPSRPADFGQERRNNPRLRALVDTFQSDINATKGELAYQFALIAELKAELDKLKDTWGKP